MADKIPIRTQINGQETDFLCEPRQSLLEVLRENLGMIGTKEGCNDGNCGACTVILDGRIVDSCLVLGVEVEGSELETIEGLSSPDGLHPNQWLWWNIQPLMICPHPVYQHKTGLHR